MNRLPALSWVLALSCSLAAAAQDDTARSGPWSGVLINSGCTPEEAFAEVEKCTDPAAPGPLVLYDDTTRQVFSLGPQATAVGHLGASVTVRGQLDGDSIRVSSLELLTSIGVAVGQKAPAFSARDQFGREQSLDTLKGTRGTVLLFFRSADW